MTQVSNDQGNQNPKNAEAKKRLIVRGIWGAAQEASWRAYQYPKGAAWGWSYPIFDLETGEVYLNPQNGKRVLRWKNFDKQTQGGEKYGWPYGQKKCPPYYVLPGTQEAIATAEGLCYIAAGEVDVLSYRSAGINNVFCWLNGEGSVPRDLAEVALMLGMTHLVYFV